MAEKKFVMIRVQGRNMTGFSHDGEEFTVDAKSGQMEIPAFLLPLAESHGFRKIEQGK
jgi:hypothetical protein